MWILDATPLGYGGSINLLDTLENASAPRVNAYEFRIDVEREAEAHGWVTVGMVLEGDGQIMENAEGTRYQHEAAECLALSNWHAARRIMADEVGPEGEQWVSLHTGILYNAENVDAHRVAEEISGALAGYPILDEDDHTEREHAAMIEEISGSPVNLPDDVDPDDVLSALDFPTPGEITMTMIEDAVSGMGYTACGECADESWLTPMDARHGEPLCRECALGEAEDAAVSVAGYVVAGEDTDAARDALRAVVLPYLDTYAARQGAAYREDVRAVVRGSEAGYRAVYVCAPAGQLTFA